MTDKNILHSAIVADKNNDKDPIATANFVILLCNLTNINSPGLDEVQIKELARYLRLVIIYQIGSNTFDYLSCNSLDDEEKNECKCLNDYFLIFKKLLKQFNSFEKWELAFETLSLETSSLFLREITEDHDELKKVNLKDRMKIIFDAHSLLETIYA